jgi:lipoate-protein ligase B
MVKLLNVLKLGMEPYDTALELQHRLVAARKAGSIEDTLVLLEHPHVMTLGRRADEGNILVSREWLDEHGVQVRRVERGGDVTYHGPGQLVGYPIVDLRRHQQDVGWYMRSLEEVLILTLFDFGISARRLARHIGVWVDDRRKIASLGTRIEDWITYHGFALNVHPDLAYFRLIVPCGLVGKEVTSMEEVLGQRVDMAEVCDRIVHRFCQVFGASSRRMELAELPLPMETGRGIGSAESESTP